MSAFTTAYFRDEEGYNYFYIISLANARHVAKIYDYTRHKQIASIEYYGHFDSNIAELAASNGYLYVLRKSVKTIDVYSLIKCQELDVCQIEFQIDATTLKHKGVDYFAPEKIVTDFAHP